MRLHTNPDPRSGETLYFRDGVRITKAEYEAAIAAMPNRLNLGAEGEPLVGQGTTGWPLTSEACAVHPNQVERANEWNRRNGVNVQHDPKTGNAIIPDRAERKRLLRLRGYVDRNSFTGG